MGEKKQRSVEEILAYCRKVDGGAEGGSPGGSEEAAASPPAPSDEPKAQGTAAKAKGSAAAPSGPKKNPKEMSVAEILAAARAEKAGGAAQGAGAAERPAAKPARGAGAAPDRPAAGPRGKQAQPAAPAGAAHKPPPMDTASILAAARRDAKRGPVSKSEREAAPAKPRPRRKPVMPKRPDFGRPAGQTETEPATRRGFLGAVTAMAVGSSLAVGMISLAVTSILSLLGLARFMFPNILIEPPMTFRVGFPDELAPGQVETRFKAQFGVWIVRHEYKGQDIIYALQSICTHLGCTPNWLEAEQKFKCPCHGSGFYKSGINFEGPAPRPLERFAIRVADDGQLEVDKSRTFRQEMGQWEDPASYVVV